MAQIASAVSSASSSLNLSLHPLPILNVSEHLTRLKLQTGLQNPFIIGALLGTQNGRDVEIVNSFDLITNAEPGKDLGFGEAVGIQVESGFLNERKEQYKQVFPNLDLIGWYTVAAGPTQAHAAIHEQFTAFITTPLLLILSPGSQSETGGLPIKVYEAIVEIKDRQTRTAFVPVPEKIETGEAERIAVDWTARGGEGSNTLAAHLQTQRTAIKMLYDRIVVLVNYVSGVIAGSAKKDYDALRALNSLVASLPASEHPEFREEFDTEYADVQLTALLATLTKSTLQLSEIVNSHILLTSSEGRKLTKDANKSNGGTWRQFGTVGRLDRKWGRFSDFTNHRLQSVPVM
ncbi:maintenance of mitochondrial structure and function-domain-containing protein [Cantharellus anzutake]|uniref:maintenance of mitochondrial structure and function-domain-containing protein n=1 Tax=Cantharellus anzutake TaxID=1750568 RepID=UPI0019076486|nr:maintenance of mitochondrial structure and function-domain-containing protein [Cantharellus anzutake]KAF8343770.1 maintenance of mitochondrial structure and function-domain-containing protein [Cantharellus anzutake]